MDREAVAEWRTRHHRWRLAVAAAIEQAYSRSGYKAALQTWLDHLTSSLNQAYVSPFFIATLYARLGKGDLTFEWLAKPIRSATAILLISRESNRLDNFHSDPLR
jgi:hypothetical protein